MKQCTNCQWEGKEEELKTMTSDPCDYTQEYCPKRRRKEFIIIRLWKSNW